MVATSFIRASNVSNATGQRLVCPAPVWPYPVSAAPLELKVVTLFQNNQTRENGASTNAPNAFLFAYTERVSFITPTLAFAGGSDISVW